MLIVAPSYADLTTLDLETCDAAVIVDSCLIIPTGRYVWIADTRALGRTNHLPRAQSRVTATLPVPGEVVAHFTTLKKTQPSPGLSLASGRAPGAAPPNGE